MIFFNSALCEQLLDAYTSSSSESVRTIDVKMIQSARSKLQTYNFSGSSTVEPSLNTVAELPSSAPRSSIETINLTDNKTGTVEFAADVSVNTSQSVLSKRKLDE